jgi:hypothetical protein
MGNHKIGQGARGLEKGERRTEKGRGRMGEIFKSNPKLSKSSKKSKKKRNRKMEKG